MERHIDAMKLVNPVRRYVLMTAAYNEEAHIEKTIRSVLSQTALPSRWVIVSDGSRDRTDEIIKTYANQYCCIRFLRITRQPGHSFVSKVQALQAGTKLLDGAEYDLIGNLDADISLDSSYFERLLAHFDTRPSLGLASGFVYDEINGHFQSRSINRPYAVPHAAQLMRRTCYEAIGGYAVLKYGGEDWHAQVSVRMRGWSAEAFPELRILHHRRTGEGAGLVRYKFHLGKLEYSLGSSPLFETLKCLQRLSEKPFLVGGIARLLGFFWASILREKKPVSEEFIAFLRHEQRTKLRSALQGAWPQTSRLTS